jgi:predicted transcriptional regulator
MNKPLTAVELELMTLLWRLGEGSVADVQAGLPPERKLAYTSVSTMLRILEQKGVVGARKEGRGHIYFPQLTKRDYVASSVQRLVSQVFEGAPVALVRQLLDSTDLTARDLADLRALLEEKVGQGKGSS